MATYESQNSYGHICCQRGFVEMLRINYSWCFGDDFIFYSCGKLNTES